MSLSGEDWKKYRDSAPEAVDDDSLKRLISKNRGDPVLIAAAIQDLWNGNCCFNFPFASSM